MDIPASLLTQVRDGNLVLFLGAGASLGATDSQGNPPPGSHELASLLADKFLGGSHHDDPLHIVAELSISERDLPTVQEYIHSLFEGIQPAPFHELLPTFYWTGIATTNFDLVVERAYQACPKRVQKLVPLIKNGDRVEDKLRSPDGLALLKLHGCITRTSDTQLPLILTIDQYITHRQGRSRVFDHLRGWAYEHSIVFIGHSLQDPDIRQMLLELGAERERPRFYTVTPALSDEEKRFWESKRISPVEGTFEDFLRQLDQDIPVAVRGLPAARPEAELTIAERFIVREPDLTENCRSFLTDDVDYLRPGMPAETIQPRTFYRGLSDGWSAIEQQLDVPRRLADTILSDIILTNVPTHPGTCRLYALKGHAGSGKSVLLRRIAWDASITFEKLCLFLRPHARPSFEALRELAQITGEPIFLFVDNASQRVPAILDLVTKGTRAGLPLTVLAAERHNEWNMFCEALNPHVTEDFEVRYLSSKEIEQLIALLERHQSLGTLADASHQERLDAFQVRAGRQLLVALHEATLGKPFEDIIADEYAQITPHLAQLMYLGICVLNRTAAAVRAGIVARVYGVRFTDFRQRFFRPLEEVVFTSYDQRTRDFVYTSRHPHIAQIVFERVLSSPSERLDLYSRLLSALNIDYDADRMAYRRLIRARDLLELFPDHKMAEAVYDACHQTVGPDPYFLHQRAIYEMRRDNANLQKADELLRSAQQLAPHDKGITHSLAELSLVRADKSRSQPDFATHLREARKLAVPLTGRQAVTAHGYHTLAKVGLAKLRNLLLRQPSEEVSELEFDAVIKEAARAIEDGLQLFPGDPYLLDSESELGLLLADEERALNALRKAFDINPHEPYATIRLGKHLATSGQRDQAQEVYQRAIDAGSHDKKVHYNYAKLLLDIDANGDTVEYHLRHAFTKGDRNYEAQYWYARQLYVNGKLDESSEMFRALAACPLDPSIKRNVRGVIKDGDKDKTFTGHIVKLESSYAFIQRDGPGDWVFLHITSAGEPLWRQLTLGTRSAFSIGFTFRGPAAINVQPE